MSYDLNNPPIESLDDMIAYNKANEQLIQRGMGALKMDFASFCKARREQEKARNTLLNTSGAQQQSEFGRIQKEQAAQRMMQQIAQQRVMESIKSDAQLFVKYKMGVDGITQAVIQKNDRPIDSTDTSSFNHGAYHFSSDNGISIGNPLSTGEFTIATQAPIDPKKQEVKTGKKKISQW